MTKKCPFCAETIQEDANKCRYCGEWLKTKQENKVRGNYPFIKYYLAWVVSIIVFFGSFAFSTAGRLPKIDNICVVFVGLSAIIGTGAFVKLLWIVKSKPVNRLKSIVLIVFTILGFFAVILSDLPFIKGNIPNEAGLRKTVEKQYQLANQGEQGNREIYRNYLSSSFKSSYTEDEIVKNNLTPTKYDIHSISVDGTEGFVDRTVSFCTDSSCTNVKSTSRTFKKYVYENQRWLMTEMPLFCPRKQMYEMEPEFSRALSLISQRATKDLSVDPELQDTFNEILKCIDVKYADSDSVMNSAEGLFQFIPGQSTEKLTILVSPRYKVQDDIVTAVLLMHEYKHALIYVGELNSGKTVDCYLNEAEAFQWQNRFISLLNPEEHQSLTARLITNPSPELKGISNTWKAINATKGSTFSEKTLNFVKSNPFYQKECAGR